MHVILTGGGSFIGLTVIEVLAKAGFRVTATYRGEATSAINRCQSSYPNVKFKCVDITKKNNFTRLPVRIDAVIHMAAVAPSPITNIDKMILCNMIGTRNIQRYGISAKAKCIIFMSSLSVYGNIEDSIVDENTRINNPDLYGAAKYLGERILASTADKMSVFAIRLPGVVGKGAFRSWMPKLVNQLQAGLPVKIYDPEMPFNSVIHVADLSNLIVTLLEKNALRGFHAFPFAASDAIPKAKIVTFLLEKLHSNSSVSMEAKGNKIYVVSSKYVENKFGYFPMSTKDLLAEYCLDFISEGKL
jgi:nucleoside-diphosphate-sugar epimerase